MASCTALLIAAAAMAVVVVGALLPATASAETYMVGDSNGWALQVDYDAWASGKTFRVGNTLEFVYSKEKPFRHDVVQVVDEATFDTCTVPSDALMWTSGDDRLSFAAAGQFFFICGVKAHCQSGMKLALNVVQ